MLKLDKDKQRRIFLLIFYFPISNVTLNKNANINSNILRRNKLSKYLEKNLTVVVTQVIIACNF